MILKHSVLGRTKYYPQCGTVFPWKPISGEGSYYVAHEPSPADRAIINATIQRNKMTGMYLVQLLVPMFPGHAPLGGYSPAVIAVNHLNGELLPAREIQKREEAYWLFRTSPSFRDSDYAKEYAMTDADVLQLWRKAVTMRGAHGTHWHETVLPDHYWNKSKVRPIFDYCWHQPPEEEGSIFERLGIGPWEFVANDSGFVPGEMKSVTRCRHSAMEHWTSGSKRYND